jgi:hypothetical protein
MEKADLIAELRTVVGVPLKIRISCAESDPSCNKAHAGTAREYLGVDLTIEFRAEGRKKSKFGRWVGTHDVRRPGCSMSSAPPGRPYLFFKPSQRFSS